MRETAVMVGPLPAISISPDREENFLLARAEAGRAVLLLSGDTRGLLALGSHAATRIVTAREALALLQR